MATSGINDKDELCTPPKPSVVGKRKSVEATAWYPRIGDWVKVVLDKRAKKNQALMAVPGVASRVDQAAGTVNILYPNVLSHFLHSRGQLPETLFAIETYPVKKVSAWEGETSKLEQILKHALLHFAEKRASGICGIERLRAVSAREQEESCGAERDSIKDGLKSLCGDETPPPRAKENETTSPAPVVVTPLKTLTPQQEKLEFTRRLSQLFQKNDRLSKDDIREALEQDFSSWESLLATLDGENKIFVADDLVFRV